jgi:hypothetical protein
MTSSDQFSEYYAAYLDGTYDCIDRIVLNAYFRLAQTAGGFRCWWRTLHGGDDNLDDTHLMRYAGRFARRVRACAEKNSIPLIECDRDARKHEIAQQYIPADDKFRGVFCIIVGRAPGYVRKIERFGDGGVDIVIKRPYPFVNHYHFHIMDPDWGHVIIRLCPHPPFNAQVILNGHEYVERQAKGKKISFTKEGNCFTRVSNAAGLAGVAETMTAPSGVGRLVEVCERWIYSACLLFALDLAEQEHSGFRYSYSVYQAEYSRNLLFNRGRIMEEVFQSVIDRTRAPLDIKTVKTIFGYKRRPYNHDRKGKRNRPECVVERPAYDLTVFKVHYGPLTVKIYSKGEHVLRIESITHNARKMRSNYGIDSFPQIIALLKETLERFLSVLRGVDISFISTEKLDEWPLPSKIGQSRVGGVDVNHPRIRAVMEGVIALSTDPRGFTLSQLVGKAREILDVPETLYHSRQASYDLKKFRGKGLVRKLANSRRYEVTQDGLRAMAGFLVLREKVLKPLLDSTEKLNAERSEKNRSAIDTHYSNIQKEMRRLFENIGIAA